MVLPRRRSVLLRAPSQRAWTGESRGGHVRVHRLPACSGVSHEALGSFPAPERPPGSPQETGWSSLHASGPSPSNLCETGRRGGDGECPVARSLAKGGHCRAHCLGRSPHRHHCRPHRGGAGARLDAPTAMNLPPTRPKPCVLSPTSARQRARAESTLPLGPRCRTRSRPFP
jgi:hypothetical protein